MELVDENQKRTRRLCNRHDPKACWSGCRWRWVSSVALSGCGDVRQLVRAKSANFHATSVWASLRP